MKLEKEIHQGHFRNQNHKLAVNLIFTYNWLTSNHVKLLKPHKLTLQQFNILRILRGQHPNSASIKLIKERMLDKMSDVSRLVEKLRIKGLVDRNICTHDRRHVDVIITNEGLSLLKNLDGHDNEIDKLFSKLNEAELNQLNSLLDKIRD